MGKGSAAEKELRKSKRQEKKLEKELGLDSNSDLSDGEALRELGLLSQEDDDEFRLSQEDDFLEHRPRGKRAKKAAEPKAKGKRKAAPGGDAHALGASSSRRGRRPVASPARTDTLALAETFGAELPCQAGQAEEKTKRPRKRRNEDQAAEDGLIGASNKRGKKKSAESDSEPEPFEEEVEAWIAELRKHMDAGSEDLRTAFSVKECTPKVLRRLEPSSFLGNRKLEEGGLPLYDEEGKANLHFVLGAHHTMKNQRKKRQEGDKAPDVATEAVLWESDWSYLRWLTKKARELRLVSGGEVKRRRIAAKRMLAMKRSGSYSLLLEANWAEASDVEVRELREQREQVAETQTQDVRFPERRLSSQQSQGSASALQSRLRAHNTTRLANVTISSNHKVDIQKVREQLLAPTLSFDWEDKFDEEEDLLEVEVPKDDSQSMRDIFRDQLRRSVSFQQAKNLGRGDRTISGTSVGSLGSLPASMGSLRRDPPSDWLKASQVADTASSAGTGDGASRPTGVSAAEQKNYAATQDCTPQSAGAAETQRDEGFMISPTAPFAPPELAEGGGQQPAREPCKQSEADVGSLTISPTMPCVPPEAVEDFQISPTMPCVPKNTPTPGVREVQQDSLQMRPTAPFVPQDAQLDAAAPCQISPTMPCVPKEAQEAGQAPHTTRTRPCGPLEAPEECPQHSVPVRPTAPCVLKEAQEESPEKLSLHISPTVPCVPKEAQDDSPQCQDSFHISPTVPFVCKEAQEDSPQHQDSLHISPTVPCAPKEAQEDESPQHQDSFHISPTVPCVLKEAQEDSPQRQDSFHISPTVPCVPKEAQEDERPQRQDSFHISPTVTCAPREAQENSPQRPDFQISPTMPFVPKEAQVDSPQRQDCFQISPTMPFVPKEVQEGCPARLGSFQISPTILCAPKEVEGDCSARSFQIIPTMPCIPKEADGDCSARSFQISPTMPCVPKEAEVEGSARSFQISPTLPAVPKEAQDNRPSGSSMHIISPTEPCMPKEARDEGSAQVPCVKEPDAHAMENAVEPDPSRCRENVQPSAKTAVDAGISEADAKRLKLESQWLSHKRAVQLKEQEAVRKREEAAAKAQKRKSKMFEGLGIATMSKEEQARYEAMVGGRRSATAGMEDASGDDILGGFRAPRRSVVANLGSQQP